MFLAAAMAFTIAGSPFCVYAEGQSEEQSNVQTEEQSDGGNVDREGVIKSYVGANEVFTIKPEM